MNCGMYFYHYGLTISCACTERNGTESECVQLGTGYSRPIAHRHIDFYGYLKLHAVPVFDTKKTNRTERSNLLSTPERAEEVESTIMRSPSEYSDGTRRTPLVNDEEDDDEPAYARVFRSIDRRGSVASVQVGSGNAQEERWGRRELISFLEMMEHLEEHLLFGHPPGESSPYSSSQMRPGSEFGSTTVIRPPCPPTPGPGSLPYPRPLPTSTGFPPLNFPYGPYQNYSLPYFMGGPAGQCYGTVLCFLYFFMFKHTIDPMQLWPPGVLPFTTMPNPQTPHPDRSGSSTTSTAQLNPTRTPARNPPERKGGTKFVETLPNTTPMKPEVLTPRRRRRTSRREGSNSN
ncbi:unnamed protein product [Angiostrongylus costaricensis]|uniref:Extensin-like n=1 Tax=Angiostrongylus costaricensis TaxID=334426 RepID=A0A0R3PU43_ANGCS|nr:unnamed protein product [Angiostrongylus costaricensis]